MMARTVGRIIAALVVAAPLTAQAQFTTYSSIASYEAAILNRGLDTFDDLQHEQYYGPLQRTAGSYGYKASTSMGLFGLNTAGDGWLSTNLPNSTITFGYFTSGVRGVGFNLFATDEVGSTASCALMGVEVEVRYSDVHGSYMSKVFSNPTPNTFFGVVSKNGDMKKVEVRAYATRHGKGDPFVTVDDVRLGGGPVSTVPEPSTYALMAVGLAVMSAVARRRRTN